MIQNLLSRVDITADATPDYIQFPVGLEDDDRIALVVAPGYNANLSFSTKAADAPKVDVPMIALLLTTTHFGMAPQPTRRALPLRRRPPRSVCLSTS